MLILWFMTDRPKYCQDALCDKVEYPEEKNQLNWNQSWCLERALASHPNMDGARFLPSAICGLNLLLVLALLRGFFSGLSGFPYSPKANTPNSDSTRIEDSRENKLKLMWLPP